MTYVITFMDVVVIKLNSERVNTKGNIPSVDLFRKTIKQHERGYLCIAIIRITHL